MKNTFKLIGIIALLAVSGFLWRPAVEMMGGQALMVHEFRNLTEDQSYTLLKARFLLWIRKVFQPFISSGTFTHTDSTITFKLPELNSEWTQNYILTDSYLELIRMSSNDQHYSGKFYKQQ
jgi:hypothetical protein